MQIARGFFMLGEADGSDRGGGAAGESAFRTGAYFAIVDGGTESIISRNQSYSFGRDVCFEGMNF